MSKRKKDRKDAGKSHRKQVSVTVKIVEIDGVKCANLVDLKQLANSSALSMGLSDEQHIQQFVQMFLFRISEQLAGTGIQIYNEAKNTLIEIGPRTDDGIPQWIERRRGGLARIRPE